MKKLQLFSMVFAMLFVFALASVASAETVVKSQSVVLKALNADLVLDISPATTTLTARSTASTRTVTITLKDAKGFTHSWFNRTVTTGCSVGHTSTLGEATIPSTTLTFVNGVATVVVTNSAHAWVAEETATLTVANIVVLGVTVTGGTSVQTVIAAP